MCQQLNIIVEMERQYILEIMEEFGFSEGHNRDIVIHEGLVPLLPLRLVSRITRSFRYYLGKLRFSEYVTRNELEIMRIDGHCLCNLSNDQKIRLYNFIERVSSLNM